MIRKNLDLLIALLWPIIATFVSFLLKVGNFVSIILFLGVPSLYLAIRDRRYARKALLFTLISSILTIIALDYIAQVTGAWLMFPDSILPFKLFGLVTFEVILWAFFTCFFIVLFYEYFLSEQVVKKLWTSRMGYLLALELLAFLIFCVLFLRFPTFLEISFFYLKFGVVLLLVPSVLYFFKHTKKFLKFLPATVYFFYFNFIYEIIALKLGWWSFPGKEFIGWLSILGIRFPIEEFIFCFILLSLATLSYYEYSKGGRK